VNQSIQASQALGCAEDLGGELFAFDVTGLIQDRRAELGDYLRVCRTGLASTWWPRASASMT